MVRGVLDRDADPLPLNSISSMTELRANPSCCRARQVIGLDKPFNYVLDHILPVPPAQSDTHHTTVVVSTAY